MVRLAAVLYILVATVLGGVAVTALLTLKMMEGWQLAAGFAAGCLLAVPIAAVLGSKIYKAIKPTHA